MVRAHDHTHSTSSPTHAQPTTDVGRLRTVHLVTSLSHGVHCSPVTSLSQGVQSISDPPAQRRLRRKRGQLGAVSRPCSRRLTGPRESPSLPQVVCHGSGQHTLAGRECVQHAVGSQPGAPSGCVLLSTATDPRRARDPPTASARVARVSELTCHVRACCLAPVLESHNDSGDREELPDGAACWNGTGTLRCLWGL